MSEDKKPLKKDISKKSSSKKKSSATCEADSISKPEQINIEHLFKEALTRYHTKELENNKNKAKELTHLSLMCEEYLSAYALIGYSLQDEKVVIFNTPTQKDEAALVDLLRATFFQLVQNRP